MPSSQTIAVILPTFCPGDYLTSMIHSIESQECKEGNSNIKITLYLVLNGPREPYLTRIKEILEMSSVDYKVAYTSEPGVSRARNVGLDLSCSYDYVVFVDDDDVLSPRYLLSLLRAVRDESHIAQSRTSVLNECGQSLSDHYINRAFDDVVCNGDRAYTPYRYRKFLNTVWGKIFPRKLIGENRFDESVSISEDALFLFTLSSRIKGISLAPEAVYAVRQRPLSASRKHKPMCALVRESMLFIRKVSQVYWKAPLRFSFLLYVSRILASLKFLIIRMKNQL